jgi:hypothetical protein
MAENKHENLKKLKQVISMNTLIGSNGHQCCDSLKKKVGKKDGK